LDVPARAKTPERQRHNSPTSSTSPQVIRVLQSDATETNVSTRTQPEQRTVTPAVVNAREDDLRAQPKSVTLDLRERPRPPFPETTRTSTAGVAKAAASAADNSLAEQQRETAPTQNSPPVAAGRSEAAKAQEFRVNWVEGIRSIPPAAREKVEREVVRVARAEFRQRAEAAKVEQPPVEIRVEHLTVKIETATPAPPEPRTNRRTAPAGGAPDFSDYFLRRSISGF